MRPNATYTLSGLSFSGRNQHCDFNSFGFFILFWTINPKKVVRISREEYLDIARVTKQNVLSGLRKLYAQAHYSWIQNFDILAVIDGSWV